MVFPWLLIPCSPGVSNRVAAFYLELDLHKGHVGVVARAAGRGSPAAAQRSSSHRWVRSDCVTVI